MDKSLEIALKTLNLNTLPLAIGANYKKTWIRAILKVQRTNGNVGYCDGVNGGSGVPIVTRDFYPNGIIAGVLSIHPYEEVEGEIIPRFNDGDEVISYLRRYGYDQAKIESLLSTKDKTVEQAKKDREELKGYITQVATLVAQEKSQSDKQARDLLEYAAKYKAERNKKERKNGKAASRKTKRGQSED